MGPMVVDGLGHGSMASEAERVFAESQTDSPRNALRVVLRLVAQKASDGLAQSAACLNRYEQAE
jgi:hypothetical protein